MTETEKGIIKKEIYNAYSELPKHCNADARFIIAVKYGLERAQRKLNNKEKKEK